MNNLEANDYTKLSSVEELSSILELLREKGVEVENTTWRERNDADAFIEFPYIIWLGSLDVVIGTDYTLISITDNQLSVSEFLHKSGCLDTFYHGRKFKHHIV
jgi:hypothetical protein